MLLWGHKLEQNLQKHASYSLFHEEFQLRECYYYCFRNLETFTFEDHIEDMEW
jgi:hypothetical protein